MAWLVGILLLYALTDFLCRWMGWGAHAHAARTTPKVALTFDDGPSPVTRELLELLERHGARGTFFVTGTRAERHPDLLQRIREGGHQLASHGYWHRPALFMAPWTEWVHIRRVPYPLYRPPWGIHSPFTRLLARLAGKRVVVWDVESQDWLERDPRQLAERVLRYMKPGSIVLLHDGPARTLALLEHLLPRMRALGYAAVTLEELRPHALSFREGVQRLLQGSEERFDRRRGTVRVGMGPFDVLRVEKKPYDGPPLPGIPRGVPAFEIHLESARISALGPFRAARQLRRGLAQVARMLLEDPEVRVVYGKSLLAPGARRLGFATAPLPPAERLLAAWTGRWFAWLYRGRVPAGEARLVYLTREALLERYMPPVS